ncbi:MAG: hypothetical protein LBK07_09515 [Tannerella sp.]|jgi:hypothetical protein|nr:hypothetical protein [Tannerella sp.]
MAQRKKKKKVQSQHTTTKPAYKGSPDKAHVVVKKILQVYGLAPDTLDSFTRLQRSYLFYSPVEPIRVKVEEGHRVPRRLVNFMAESTHRFMRTHCFGDASIGLTCLEFSTYGVSLALMLNAAPSSHLFQPGELEMLASVAKVINYERVVKDLEIVGKHIRKVVMMISKVNFRIYGYTWQIRNTAGVEIASTVFMSSEEPISIRFKHKQKERVAFRVRAGRVINEPPHNARIDRWFIFYRDESPSVYLDIYIQSHALQRVKERMDIFPAHKRNFYVMEPLLYMHEVRSSPAGRPMLTCYFMANDRRVCLGYFPFIIQKNRLIVLTFLPLASSSTMTGAYLCRQLGLQTEDMVFLGMDKLSFYLTVDFEQIPMLKEAIAATEIRHLMEYAANDPEMNFVIDQKKTQMVKRFFERKAEFEAAAVDDYGEEADLQSAPDPVEEQTAAPSDVLHDPQ